MPLTSTYPAALFYEAAFNAAPSQNAIPPYWTDITGRTQFPWSTTRGRQYELDTVPAGQWTITLDNRDGAIDPSNTASPYYPNVIPYRGCRIRAMLGVNALTYDQATAGEKSGYLGTPPPWLNVSNDYGYPVTIVASGSAYQGTQVYQTTVPSGATASTTILLLSSLATVPQATYSFTAQARITSGTTLATSVALLWYSNTGTYLGFASGTAQTLTSGSSSWTALSVSGQVPVGATNAALKVQLGGTIGANTTWQVDGLQFENLPTPTPFQLPQTVNANLLPRNIATGSASMALGDTVGNWWWSTGASVTVAQANYLSAAPTAQTTALAWTTPVGSTSNSAILYAGNWLGLNNPYAQPDNVQVTAGSAYTASMYVSRASSADATVQIQVSIYWYTSTSGIEFQITSSSAVTVPVGSWSRATVSGTAPVGAVWARIVVQIISPASTTAVNTVYLTSWQMEQAASASTWMDPGASAYIYTGYVERWPQTWVMSGTYGQVNAIGVDAEALLAQDTLLAPFVEEVLALGPNFFYQLNDPAGSSSCADVAAKRPPAPVENSPYGVGSLVFGSSITSNTTPGTFAGTPGPVATFANNPANTAVNQFAETIVSIHKTSAAPGPPRNGIWTRMLSFRAPAIPATGDFNLWTSYTPTFGVTSTGFFVAITSSGFISFAAGQGVLVTYTGTTNICDGNWHQIALVVNAPTSITYYVDGVQVATSGFGTGPTGCVTDVLGCAVSYGENQYSQGFVGDMAHAIEFPFALTQAQVTNLYGSFRTASSGESSGARVQRVLNWLGYSGATAIDAGSTAVMGPATDLTGATGLDALNAVALTENGNLYVSSSGALTFKGRSARYNSTYPTMIFGEQAQNGEWPYESVTFDFDPTHLFNDIQVTQFSTSQVAEAIDTPSEGLYYQRILQRTTNQGLYTETVDSANYLLQQYRTARMRVSDLTLHPAAVPGLFAACLALDVGARIRVMRRPPQAPADAVDCFVESVNWSMDPTSGDVLVHLQCSPADLGSYWTLSGIHTTLNAQANSGTNTATINALADAAVNPLAASLPPGSGYQLVFDPGTSLQETMTIAAGGVPATTIGYSTATLTFTGNFAHTHAAGAVVCEVLPSGVVNPTQYDLGSVLAPMATTLPSVIASGQNQVTVKALADAKANGASSDLIPGDLLWISPGTPQFEGYNLLTPNQSTAGEGVLPLATGTPGTAVGITGGLGTPAVTASGTAWQGANVWQVAVGASAATPNGLMYISKVRAAQNLAFTNSIYTRSATTGANPQVYLYLSFYDINGNSLSFTQSGTVTLTGSPTAAWTRLTVTATAPAGAVWSQLGVVLTGTSPTSAWSWQGDGIQVEQAGSASAYQTCPQIQSVAATVAGYSAVTVTLANNLVNTHAAGDYVTDPLPAGDTSPTQVLATSRVTY